MDSDVLYIDQNQLDEELQIITLSIHSDKLYYGRHYTQGNILVDLDKNRRQTLQIRLDVIKDLKRKVKLN